MKVLIVEDNPAMRRLLRYWLGEMVEVYECADGAEVLACYETQRPDWVLMDIRMPRTNGLEATRQLCAAHGEARVIIVTNCADEAMRQAAHRAGACGYLLKEDLHQLREMLSA